MKKDIQYNDNEPVRINMIKDADRELKTGDEDEETLDLNEPAEQEGWQSHWPLLTALVILLVMLR